MSVHLTRAGAYRAAAESEGQSVARARMRGHSSGLAARSMRPVVRSWLRFFWKVERP